MDTSGGLLLRSLHDHHSVHTGVIFLVFSISIVKIASFI
jgi:hypothetical protein